MAELAHAQASRDLLGLLLEQAQDHALILLDPEGKVVGWLVDCHYSIAG